MTRDPDLLLSRKAIMRRHTLDSDNRGSVDPSQGWELFPGNLPSLDRAVGQEAYGVDVGIRKIEIPIQHRPYGAVRPHGPYSSLSCVTHTTRVTESRMYVPVVE